MFSPPLLSMRWEDVLFAHWAVDPAIVERQVPPQFTVDTREGDAYLGVVGFRMADIRPMGAPAGLSFPELNLRTYVRTDEGPGVYFFNLDAADRLAVPIARRLFRLPYYRAEMSVTEGDGGFRLESHRTDDAALPADFDATYSPSGTPTEPEPGTLLSFLTERYRFFVADEDGRVYRGDIDHDPWQLQPADLSVRANGLFDANGFAEPESEPLVHYSPGIDVTAGPLRRSTVACSRASSGREILPDPKPAKSRPGYWRP
jgi:uncharacterized protein YqjF (DUF2071 family)